MNIALALQEIADHYHNKVVKQVRKYSGAPYTVHTDEVAEIYAAVFPDDLIGKAIAHGHDLFEDTPITALDLRDELIRRGITDLADIEAVIAGITDLTDVFVREKFPKLNRATRKANERARLAGIPTRSKNIKLADLISNTRDIVKNDPDFARVYLDEKRALLPLLIDADPRLYREADNLCREGREILDLTK